MSATTSSFLLALLIGAAQENPDTSEIFLHGGEQEISGQTESLEILPTQIALYGNGSLPRAENDGALWSGRGISWSLSSGIRVSTGQLVVVVAPEFMRSQNAPFDILSGDTEMRSTYASPLHPEGPHSMDLPLRRGSRASMAVGPGASGVYLGFSQGSVVVGLTAAPAWWGPSLKNALLLSHQAPGVPRLFASGKHRIGLGRIEWNWFTGVVTESPFFDKVPDNDRRSLAGYAMVFSPIAIDGFSIGVGHLALMPWKRDRLPSVGSLLALSFRRGDLYPNEGELASVDALTAMFLSWSRPKAGFRVGFEVAWQEPPTTLDSWLTKWAHTRAVTLSFRWRAPSGAVGDGWYVEGENTSLDQTRTRYDVPHPPDFYSGRADPHGFTHRGQLLGAIAGPGGQSLWLEVGRQMTPTTELGVFAERNRFENDAAARQRHFNFRRRDVALVGGVRGRVLRPSVDIGFSFGVEHRMNYLFHNGGANPLGLRTLDVTNPFITLSLDWTWSER